MAARPWPACPGRSALRTLHAAFVRPPQVGHEVSLGFAAFLVAAIFAGVFALGRSDS